MHFCKINIKYNIKKKQETHVDCSYMHFWGEGVVSHYWPVWACTGLHWIIFGGGVGVGVGGSGGSGGSIGGGGGGSGW